MATPSGFEPKLSGPKPLVLPLHHGVAWHIDVALSNINAFFDFFHIKNDKNHTFFNFFSKKMEKLWFLGQIFDF